MNEVSKDKITKKEGKKMKGEKKAKREEKRN
jgi:hypothetical protein